MFLTVITQGTNCLAKALLKTIEDTFISPYVLCVNEAERILNIQSNSCVNIISQKYELNMMKNKKSPYIQSKLKNAMLVLNKNAKQNRMLVVGVNDLHKNGF
ncbi:hypothetical protein COBT_001872 [Conglomerata obtusa]